MSASTNTAVLMAALALQFSLMNRNKYTPSDDIKKRFENHKKYKECIETSTNDLQFNNCICNIDTKK